MMLEIAETTLSELETELRVAIDDFGEARAELMSGNYNAFVELAFRRTRDDANARIVGLRFKIQALNELLERMKNVKPRENHR